MRKSQEVGNRVSSKNFMLIEGGEFEKSKILDFLWICWRIHVFVFRIVYCLERRFRIEVSLRVSLTDCFD